MSLLVCVALAIAWGCAVLFGGMWPAHMWCHVCLREPRWHVLDTKRGQINAWEYATVVANGLVTAVRMIDEALARCVWAVIHNKGSRSRRVYNPAKKRSTTVLVGCQTHQGPRLAFCAWPLVSNAGCVNECARMETRNNDRRRSLRSLRSQLNLASQTLILLRASRIKIAPMRALAQTNKSTPISPVSHSCRSGTLICVLFAPLNVNCAPSLNKIAGRVRSANTLAANESRTLGKCVVREFFGLFFSSLCLLCDCSPMHASGCQRICKKKTYTNGVCWDPMHKQLQWVVVHARGDDE